MRQMTISVRITLPVADDVDRKQVMNNVKNNLSEMLGYVGGTVERVTVRKDEQR